MTALLLAMVLPCSAAFAAASPQDAQKRYDAGDFQGAAAAYTALLDSAPRAAELHYNLGNAQFKAGRVGRAIASYQRAFDLRPRDEDVRHNLDFALRRAGEELVPPGVPPLLFRAFHLFSERELAGLHWLFCWAALLLAAACLPRASWRPALAPWAAGFLALWLAAGAWWAARAGIEPARRGVITAASGEVRSGPGENFPVSFTAPEGRRVQILSESGGWMEIGVLKEGAKGWLASGSVEPL